MNINPRRKDRKKAAAQIREEGYKDTFSPKEEMTKTMEENQTEEKSTKVDETIVTKPEPVEEPTADEIQNKQSEALRDAEPSKTTATKKKSRKAAKNEQKQYEYSYSTISVDSDLLMAVQIASKIKGEKLKDFTREAFVKHLKSLVKKGELPDLPQFTIS